MLPLPNTRSTAWIPFIAVSFVVNFVMLVLSRIILNIETSLKMNFILFGISGIVSLVGVTGYFGFKTWYVVSAIGNIAGIAFMLFLCLTAKADNWADITSIINYLIFSGGTFLVGGVTEAGIYVYRKTLKIS